MRREAKPAPSRGEALLEVSNLTKHYPVRKSAFWRSGGQVHAVDDVSFSIADGETLGLVGESGCGKSTASKTILRLIEPTAGTIRWRGTRIDRAAECRTLGTAAEIESFLNP